MPWWGYSLVALLFSPGYSLGSKWALNLKINQTKLLAYIFSGLFLGYLFYNLKDPSSLFEKVHNPLFYVWGVLAAIFSVAGNVFHQKSFEKSHNPGYVQAVIVSNAILVLFASVILFNAPIAWMKLLGIIISVMGLYLLVVNKSEAGNSKSGWQSSAILAMVLYSAMFLVVKQMSNLEFRPEQILLILIFFATIGFWGMCIIQGVGLKIREAPKIIFVPILVAVAFSFVNNLANYVAIGLVPNAGYATAIANCGALLILPLSFFFFPKKAGGEFNLKKWLGVLVVIGGALLVILG